MLRVTHFTCIYWTLPLTHSCPLTSRSLLNIYHNGSPNICEEGGRDSESWQCVCFFQLRYQEECISSNCSGLQSARSYERKYTCKYGTNLRRSLTNRRSTERSTTSQPRSSLGFCHSSSDKRPGPIYGKDLHATTADVHKGRRTVSMGRREQEVSGFHSRNCGQRIGSLWSWDRQVDCPSSMLISDPSYDTTHVPILKYIPRENLLMNWWTV